MSKSKERSPLENLRGQLRALQSENKRLRKELARSEKGNKKKLAMYSELTTATDPSYATPEIEIDDDQPCCKKCNGAVKETDLGTRLLYACLKETCKFRQIILKPK